MKLNLLITFFFSGISALIYQITWQRLLTIYYGVGAISIALIVSVYMFGLGLGALWAGRFSKTHKDLIGLYFLIELGIGIFGILSFPIIMTIGKKTAGSPYILAAFFESILIFIPTVLMGMSLPVLIKIFNQFIPNLSKSISRLYFVNTLGAAAGSLIASYWLISFYGIKQAIIVAAVINLLLAANILMLRILGTKKLNNEVLLEKSSMPQKTVLRIPTLVFVTGFLAIGYELIWFRIIGVLVKSSSYAFASVLAVYLLGIAIGSYCIAGFIKKMSLAQRKSLFFKIQIWIALSVAVIFIGYYYATLNTSFKVWTEMSFKQIEHPGIYSFLKTYGTNTFLELIVRLFRLGDVFIWPVFFLLIPTILMGASFPLIVGVACEENADIARAAGKTYFFNVLGNLTGGIMTGLLLLPLLGSELTTFLFIFVGLLFAYPLLKEGKSPKFYLSLVCIALLIGYFFPKKGEIFKVIHPTFAGFKQYFSEGREGVVMTYVNDEGTVHNYINGDSHGGRPAYSFYVQVVEGVGAAQNFENILVIGYGTGSITEGILKVPGVKKVTVVELNQTLLKNLAQIPIFQELMKDPRLTFVLDDARRFLQSRKDQYDLVFMSPLRSTVAYSNNIYSQQFFELVSAHLTTNGIFVVWSDALDTTFRTIDQVFPYKRLHVGNMDGFYLASNKPLAQYKNAAAIKSMFLSFNQAFQDKILAASQGVDIIIPETLRAHMHNYPPLQDWRPMSEYYLGIWFANHSLKKQDTKTNKVSPKL